MQIHVVQPEQTLSAIADMYGVSANTLEVANRIPNPDHLVVGQALVIPIKGMYYWVRQGDSLYTIGKKFGITARRLAEVNRIPLYRPLQIGQRLYIPPKPRRVAEVYAYADIDAHKVSPRLKKNVEDVATQLTFFGPSSYQVKADGTLVEPDLDDFFTIARENDVVMSMVITNTVGHQFDAELARTVLTNDDIQNKLLDNIIETAKREGFGDVHLDIERVYGDDREAYNRFLRRAARRIHDNGLLMSTALAPKVSATHTGEWYSAHDYRVHGEVADFVVLVTYEWGHRDGPPMPVSPIGPVRKVLEYAVTEIPPEKIMMGQNLYGYDWTLPYEKGTTAEALSPQAAIALAAKHSVQIHYDTAAQAPFFTYTDNDGKEHKVWFEDARSIQAKFNLLKELGLRGVSYWRLGLPFPQNWLLIQDNFTVRKR